MIKIFEKVGLHKSAIFQGERRLRSQILGDTLNGSQSLQFEMFGKINGAETTSAQNGNDSVFAKQYDFFDCVIRSFLSVADLHLMHMFIS